MARRTLTVDGDRWEVYPFEQGTGPQRRRRVTHFSPLGARSPDRAFAELSERELLELFRQSQPAWTAPEVDYAAH